MGHVGLDIGRDRRQWPGPDHGDVHPGADPAAGDLDVYPWQVAAGDPVDSRGVMLNSGSVEGGAGRQAPNHFVADGEASTGAGVLATDRAVSHGRDHG